MSDILGVFHAQDLEVVVLLECFLKAVLNQTGLNLLGDVQAVGFFDDRQGGFAGTEAGDASLSHEAF